MEIEVLIFECSNRYFGLRASCIKEVLRSVALSPVPKSPPGVTGLVNLRGSVLPVLDTSQLLGLESNPIRHTDHFVVIECGKIVFALHVARALDLIKVCSDSNSNEVPPDRSRMVDFVVKTDCGVVQVIDPERILSDASMSQLMSIATTVTATERKV